MTEFQITKQTCFVCCFSGLHWSLVIIAFYTFIPNLPQTLITLACKQTNTVFKKYYIFIPILPRMLITLACKQTNRNTQKYYTFIPFLPWTVRSIYCLRQQTILKTDKVGRWEGHSYPGEKTKGSLIICKYEAENVLNVVNFWEIFGLCIVKVRLIYIK